MIPICVGKVAKLAGCASVVYLNDLMLSHLFGVKEKI
jgi:hypothetical protein